MAIATQNFTSLQFKTGIYRLDYLLNVHYLEIPAEVVEQIGTLKIRLLCTVNQKLTFQCGLMALGEGKAYITLSNQRLKVLKVKEGDDVLVELQKDESKYGYPMPEELTELFEQDYEGFRRFELLKPGMQRYLMQHVDGVKNPQLRVDRAITLIENLKREPVGQEVWRRMLGKE